tara:strand:+ start:676 stop:936 length:261 start_codon:yes stop_codon:yes gene_type:complete
MTPQEYTDIVMDINEELEENLKGDYGVNTSLVFASSGYIDMVWIGSNCIWDSENDTTQHKKVEFSRIIKIKMFEYADSICNFNFKP